MTHIDSDILCSMQDDIEIRQKWLRYGHKTVCPNMDITPLVGPLVYFISTIALSLIVYILSAIYSSLYVKMFGLFPKKTIF